MKRLIILVLGLILLFCGCGAKTITVNGEKIEKNFNALMAKAELFFADGEYEEAILCYSAAIEIETRSFEANFGLGRSYRSVGDTENAIITLQTAIELEEGTCLATYELGYTYIDCGKFDKAEDLIIPLWESGDVEAGMVLLAVYTSEGNTEDALALMENESLSAYLGHQQKTKDYTDIFDAILASDKNGVIDIMGKPLREYEGEEEQLGTYHKVYEYYYPGFSVNWGWDGYPQICVTDKGIMAYGIIFSMTGQEVEEILETYPPERTEEGLYRIGCYGESDLIITIYYNDKDLTDMNKFEICVPSVW